MQTRTAVPRPFAHPPVSRLAAAAALLLTLQACADGAPTAPEPESPRLSHQGAAHVVINEIMADPNRVTDADGEWFELYNWGAAAIDVGGWIIASNDGSHTIAGSLFVPLRPRGSFSRPAVRGGAVAGGRWLGPAVVRFGCQGGLRGADPRAGTRAPCPGGDPSRGVQRSTSRASARR